MKKLISFLLALSMIITLHSCKVKDGEPGPAGDNSLLKQGSVSGTMYYKYANGDTAIVPFNHEYYESMNYNTFAFDSINNNEFKLDFYRSPLKETNSFLYFNLIGSINANNILEAPIYNNIEFSLVNNYKNKIYYWNVLSNSYFNTTITDFKIDLKTGMATFNFVIDVPPSGINVNKVDDVTHFIIKGSVNVVLDEIPYSGCFNC